MGRIDPIVSTVGNVTLTGQGYANGTVGYQCYRCGQWVAGVAHDCRPPITVGTFYPPVAPIVSPLACNHCRCIDVPPSGERTKPHRKCCVCGSIHVAE